jgi:hypothetical protein
MMMLQCGAISTGGHRKSRKIMLCKKFCSEELISVKHLSLKNPRKKTWCLEKSRTSEQTPFKKKLSYESKILNKCDTEILGTLGQSNRAPPKSSETIPLNFELKESHGLLHVLFTFLYTAT